MWRSFKLFGDLVKFEHTVFALPFAYVGCLMAADGRPSAAQWLWVTLAMVGARTAGMTFNRLIDRHIDARNPRTRDRAIPAGRISPRLALGLAIASLALLLEAAAHLSPLALALSPLAVALLVGYSYLKRFTPYAHLGLGLVLACAPAGGWVAIRGTLDLAPCLVAAAVVLWVAGFDVLYACLDVDFDRVEGLHSIPARFGVGRALSLARLMHLGAVVLLGAAGLTLGLGPVYFAGIGVAAVLLGWEHTLVRPDDLTKMDQAFFTMNGWVSVSLLAFTWLSYRLSTVDTRELLTWISTR
jgi:4-hydroxybenzoate polyprenyltransferase